MAGYQPLVTPYCLPLDLAERLVREAGDIATLKVVLAVARLAIRQGQPAVPIAAVYSDQALRQGLRPGGTDREPRNEIAHAIDIAVARGFLIRLRGTTLSGQDLEWVALANPETIALAHHQPHQLVPRGTEPPPSIVIERPNVFSLYEQNIGPLTPLIAEQLAEALERYPPAWVEAAIVEAVHYGRRNWRYIQRILERWATEGRSDETHSRDQRARRLDPDKYLRGKYAPLFWSTE
ncbi:DnaD domain protein [Thermomicrobium sp. 4228-Ro]|uniref:DnaD domain-containing protein n=1 Tax=Thermomicrobium sp. 4228-Ro TaxID=2993937 RepID=UPI002248A5BC|nr:DnaD domain protein [Thermomicrobium sp. 4228-Ro]MCX2726200.1 DnaD domain protein [Thermomicrobium sp. 4228-Ro]